MKAVLSRTVPADMKPCGARKPAGRLAVAIIEEHYEAEDFRSLLGINFFDDVTWFNKEGFEAALFYGSLFFTLESDAALAEYSGKKKKAGAGKKEKTASAKAAPLRWRDRVKIIAELAEALTRAEETSGYRLDGLLDTLSGIEPDKPSVGKNQKGKKK
jgi:hypothetical protein